MKQRVWGNVSCVAVLGLGVVLASVFVVGLSAMRGTKYPRTIHGGHVSFRPRVLRTKDLQSFVTSSSEVTADVTPSQGPDDSTQQRE